MSSGIRKKSCGLVAELSFVNGASRMQVLVSSLIQHARASNRAPNAPPPFWLGGQSVHAVDPLLDRSMAIARMGAWSFDLSANRLSWTSGVYELFGLPRDTELDRRQTVEMYTEDTREVMERLRAEAIATSGVFTVDAQIKRSNGEMRWMRINGEMTRGACGAPILHGIKQDVTEERLRLVTMRRLAENDALTALASRTVFESRFLNKRDTTQTVVPLGALVLFDLDGFKGINDRFGHLAGDACLKAFAERLSASFPDALLIARVGGDEFAVLVSNNESAELLEARVNRFLTQLRAPIICRDHLFTIGATSGVAVPADPYSFDPEELFVRADTALYAKKRTCRRTRPSIQR